MHIEHIALWTHDLERLKNFYAAYFGASTGTKYSNPAKGFQSYFLTFESGSRIEIMHSTALVDTVIKPVTPTVGLTHLAFSAGSEEAVINLTARLQKDGYQVYSAPRRTGDGYFESAILDPDGNLIEITA